MRTALSFVQSRIGGTVLIAWFAIMLVVGAGLLAKHIVALPAPAKNEHLEASLGALDLSGKMFAIAVSGQF